MDNLLVHNVSIVQSQVIPIQNLRDLLVWLLTGFPVWFAKSEAEFVFKQGSM